MNDGLILFLYCLFAFGLAAISGKFIIPELNKLQLGQHIRKDGPKEHYAKAGTPTFGGTIFLLAFTVMVIVYLATSYDPLVLAVFLFVLAHAVIGFVDDYVNVRVNNDGLKDAQKTLLLLIVEVVFVIYYLYGSGKEIRLIFPYVEAPIIVSGKWKILYALFLVFYFFACVNAANIIDGVDGLASTVTIVTLTFTGLTAYIFYQKAVNSSSFAMAVLSVIMIGALLGFLIYNWYKAKCFMGDMGSLALGALLSVIFLILEIPWAFLLSGVMYVIDIATVLIQTTYFKASGGKRIFKMTPIHHQFEIEGWSEVQVVTVFALAQLAGSIVAACLLWPQFF